MPCRSFAHKANVCTEENSFCTKMKMEMEMEILDMPMSAAVLGTCMLTYEYKQV